MKIRAIIFIEIAVIVAIIFFSSIIFTIKGLIDYEKSRLLTYPAMAIAVALYPIYMMMRKRGLILEPPNNVQIRYLIFVILVVTTLKAIVFLCLIL